MKVLTYRVLLNEEPEGGFTVLIPSLPGCITFGDTLDEALVMAKEAIEGYIEILKERGEKVPDDSKTFEYSLSIPS
jgi:antitoxin HicB